MTRDAVEFITPLTLQTLSKNPVTTSFFDEKENWRPGHIELADRASLLLIAPATANVIAELAHGLAGHPLAAIALTLRERKDSRHMDPYDQVRVKSRDRLSIVKLAPTVSAPPEPPATAAVETKA